MEVSSGPSDLERRTSGPWDLSYSKAFGAEDLLTGGSEKPEAAEEGRGVPYNEPVEAQP